jgi:hypothetical protein
MAQDIQQYIANRRPYKRKFGAEKEKRNQTQGLRFFAIRQGTSHVSREGRS